MHDFQISNSRFQIPNPNQCSQCEVLGQFGCGARILRVVHGRDARATFLN
jgi:hypothetical protein